MISLIVPYRKINDGIGKKIMKETSRKILHDVIVQFCKKYLKKESWNL